MINQLRSHDSRVFFIPEVVQTSEMDCGPATLKSMLEGFGVKVSYGRLREACQTDVDGTSIDVLEDVANQLGLEAEQIIIPTDHIFLTKSTTLPAIIITRLPDGATHFIVLWRRIGNFIQIMDPGTGRRWTTVRELLDHVYVHMMAVDRDAWWDWAKSDGFCEPLGERMESLGMKPEKVSDIIRSGQESESWFLLALYDAATRMTESIISARGIDRGSQAETVFDGLMKAVMSEPENIFRFIPTPFWTVQPIEDDENLLLFRGAVMIQVLGRRSAEDTFAYEDLSAELRAALEVESRKPEVAILDIIREDGFLAPIVLILASFVAAFTVMIEGLLMQGILSVGDDMSTVDQRIRFMVGLIVFFIGLLLLEFPIVSITLRLGRHIEAKLRIAFLSKIPQLSDRYFHSRLTSDMVSRAHDLRLLRTLPQIGRGLVVTAFQFIFTTIGVIWLDPSSYLLALAAMISSIGLVLVTQPMLFERDLRVQTHNGALSRFYLDSLIGLSPLRTHSAERAVRRQYEGLLVEWVRAMLELIRIDVLLAALGSVIGSIFSIWILFSYVQRGGEASSGLLLFYWTMSIPSLGQSLANQIQQYPVLRNRLLRLLEPLDAPNEMELQEFPKNAKPPISLVNPEQSSVSILIDNVTVQAGGQQILKDINLAIHAGEHLAIVGPSGAGKSSLVGLLLGWHFPAKGIVWIDDGVLDGNRLEQLRQETAWVDPDVYLWNRTLFDNLIFGTEKISPNDIGVAIENANLFDVLKRLSGGLQTRLGEGGGLVSGGEGQRVRLGRAMLRDNVRLVILDEPFRGLDRTQRKQLLNRIREYWKDITIIAVTHDVTSTEDFERVLVIEDGHIIEDDKPATLLAQESRYRVLYDTDIAVNEGLWQSPIWRRLWVGEGAIRESRSEAR